MHDWLNRLINDPAMSMLIDRLTPGRAQPVRGVWGSSPHLTAGAIHRRTQRPVLLVLAHLDDADEALDDLHLFGELDAASFPALEVMPGETNVSLELLSDRLALADRLSSGEQPAVIVAPVQALMQSVPPPQAMGALVRTIRMGDESPIGELTAWLDSAGYKRVTAIEQPGEFAVRGGILDVFAPGDSPPVRLDFFGDVVDAMAEIDLDTMGSDRKLTQVRLLSANTEMIQSHEDATNLWSMLDERTIVVMAEMLEVAEQARGYYERLTDSRGIYGSDAVFKALGKFAGVHLNQFGPTQQTDQMVLPVERLMHFADNAGQAVEELAKLAVGSTQMELATHDVVVLCAKEAERDRLRELLLERSQEAAEKIVLEVGYLFRGFVWQPPEAKPLALVPHHELFHRYTQRRRVRRVTASGGTETFFDIDVDDYVVHADHGIAIFKGLRTMKKGDAGEEYLTLEFADRALLHVPASQIELVNKYIGGFAGRPQLSKLGGKRWKSQKQQVAEAVKDLAAELLRVQAARAALPGISFPQDDVWMRQFEEEFPFDETDDQLAAIAEVKRDMMRARPMDRLICGDVGFGKTEVAMRAVFKAVEAGRQVAVLCPTTVLCEQHERTFRQRMADYPVRIASLSRFRTDMEIAEAVGGLAAGLVDVAIGTHRLLSDDVVFKDLGVVIIDEEQRFGVEHKNKLMRFRVTVDVLTLSATPIPRTLHMALLGLRDISSLTTAPADRRAIVTEVVPHERQRIRTAILRELNRGGQCFFVHNRVHNIHAAANEIRSLVPEARVIVGHGQMRPRELEDVMLKFVRGESDVLVSTTIIESGIDIPTANTMFIADADRFGLAELHQLRGRVGRYKHRAYCYLLLPGTRTLTDVAAKRLRAIEQYSMLGAGFKIAMRDMEIRGVGNIIGPQQSGHIASVGYQMYCQLLEQATANLKDQTIKRTELTHMELGIAGQLPARWIPSARHRMEAYRRINRAADGDALWAVERDLVDAYGELPSEARMLMELAEVRIALTDLGVESLKRHEQDLIFSTRNVQKVYERLGKAPGSVRLIDTPTEEKVGTVYLRPPVKYLESGATLLAVLRKLLVS